MLQANNYLHFDCGEAWMKKENNTAFKVKMGSFAVAKVCELVGEYILSKLRLLQERSVGLCSYDGFAILRHASGHDAELTRVPSNLTANRIAPHNVWTCSG